MENYFVKYIDLLYDNMNKIDTEIIHLQAKKERLKEEIAKEIEKKKKMED